MGQVPKNTNYLILGSGRAAKHFEFYLKQLKLPVKTWSRKLNTKSELIELAQSATHILFLLSDNAIEEFARLAIFEDKVRVHFSGALVSDSSVGAHPLMTFTEELYEPDFYRTIPFVVEHDHTLAEILPGLSNPCYFIPKESKAFYHALCVLSGNLTVALWQKVFAEAEHKLNLPKEVFFPYLKKTTDNLASNSDQALTGPVTRGDVETIHKNIGSLENSPLKEAYDVFLGLAPEVTL